MKLLKIGRLDIPRNRWLGSALVFDRVDVFSLGHEAPLSDERFHYHHLGGNPLLRRLNFRLVNVATQYRGIPTCAKFAGGMLRLLNRPRLRSIGKMNYDCVYSSYNDYDESGLFTYLLQPFLRRDIPVVRACKETRPGFNWFERRCFEMANVVVLNHAKNFEYFRAKYPTIAWADKAIHTDLDEDWRARCVVNRVSFSPKLSAQDDKLHAVILCGVAKSDESDPRSGARQHHLPTIQGLITSGIKVHLHTLRIETTKDGRNPYKELQQRSPNSFFIEPSLAFDNDDPSSAYKVLSRYDIGVLHNFSVGADVSHFDRVNIPNRFHEYQQAGVLPIVRRGTAEVVEELVAVNRCGLVYDQFSDITREALAPMIAYRPSFEDYCEELFLKRLGSTLVIGGGDVRDHCH